MPSAWPDSTPPDETDKPGGNVPLKKLYVYGLVPPLAVIVCEYAVCTVPTVNTQLVPPPPGDSVIAGQVCTTSVYALAPEQLFTSVAWTVKL